MLTNERARGDVARARQRADANAALDFLDRRQRQRIDVDHPHRLLDHNIYLPKGMPIAATAHQAGTVRFGRDPASSALDVNCKAHELDNLYVVDTSFFPSIGAVNPSLTAIANSLRVGDHLIDRLS